MEVRHLRSFCMIASAGSLTAAASELGLTQAALSRQMSAMEADLGTALFHRNGRGLLITQAGQRLLEHAHLILQQVASAERAVKGDQSAARGNFALGLPPSLARTMVVPLVQACKDRLAEVNLRCLDGLSANLLELVGGGKLDCAVVYDSAGSDKVKLHALAEEDLYLVTGPDRPATLGKAVTLAQIASLPLIVAGPHNAVHVALASAMSAAGREVKVAHEIANLNAILDMVRAGHGSSVIPLSGVHSCIGDPALQLHRIRRPALTCRLSIALPTQFAWDPVTDEMLKILRTMLPRWVADYRTEVEAAVVRRHGAA